MSDTDRGQEPTASSQSAEMDPLIGLNLGGYVISKLLAAGGMGLVYEARHETIGRRAAVKVLRPEMASDEQWTKRFLTEARAIAALNHRNIVEILNFGNTPDGRQYMMMAFLEGESLEEYLARLAPLPPAVALGLAEQVLNGLSEAHKKGVVHRDLKPSNISVVREHNGELQVKILDFGLARQDPVHLGDLTTAPRALEGSSLLAGTPEYIAPEQALGEAVAAAADLYSLGVLLFEMLTARLPFQSESVAELLQLHVNEPAPRLGDFLTGLPEGLEDFVGSLLAKDPLARPRSADLARRQVQRLQQRLASQSTTMRPGPELAVGATQKLARPSSVVETTDRLPTPRRGATSETEPARSKRPPTGVIIGVAVGLVLAGLGATLVRRQPGPGAPEVKPAVRVLPTTPAAVPVEVPVAVPASVSAPPALPVEVVEKPSPPPVVVPAVAAPRPARKPAVEVCTPDARWKANLRQDLSELRELASKNPQLFEQTTEESDAISHAVQAATSSSACAEVEKRFAVLRKKVLAAP